MDITLGSCPLCSGDLMYLGSLGVMMHARCRQCGATMLAKVRVEDDDDRCLAKEEEDDARNAEYGDMFDA